MKLGKQNTIKTFLLVSMIFVLLSSTIAYAQIFTDVPDSHWAKDYIDRMYQLGIINGNPDATFRPDDNVTKIQAIVLVSRLYGLDENEITEINQKYQSFLNQNNIETWYQDGISVAMATGIVDQATVQRLYTNKEGLKPATREDICQYLIRAMGLEEEALNKAYYVLPFNDAVTISQEAKPYIDMMLSKDIISKEGVGDGNFKPQMSVTRAQMATFLSRVYDYMARNEVEPNIDSGQSNPSTGPSIPQDSGNSSADIITGRIISILPMQLTNETYVTIEDGQGKSTTYIINANTKILFDNQNAAVSDLIEGLQVELVADSSYQITAMYIESTEEAYTGKVKSITYSVPAKLTIEYEESRQTQLKTFVIANNPYIELDGEEAYIRDLDKGDLIDIQVENGQIIEVVGESMNKYREGIIKEILYMPESKLIIKNDGDTYEVELDEWTEIEKNNRDAEITDLKVGDEVDISYEYDMVTHIDAWVVEGEDQGIIKSILIASKPELTILNEEGEEATYYVSKRAIIEIDNRTKSLYDLRLGYYVELELESNEIIYLEGEEREQVDSYIGNIEDIDNRAGRVEISIIDPNTGKREIMEIELTDATTILDIQGNTIRLRDIDEKDQVLVVGTYDGEVVIAKTLMLMQSIR